MTAIPKGAGGRGQLYVNDELVGNSEFPTTVPILFGIEGLSCGYDFGEAVSSEYHGPFRFTGEIHEVTLDLSGELIRDDEAAYGPAAGNSSRRDIAYCANLGAF